MTCVILPSKKNFPEENLSIEFDTGSTTNVDGQRELLKYTKLSPKLVINDRFLERQKMRQSNLNDINTNPSSARTSNHVNKEGLLPANSFTMSSNNTNEPSMEQ